MTLSLRILKQIVSIFLPAIICFIFFGGCSLKNAADQMKDDTRHLSDNSDSLATDSSHLGKRTDDLEGELTQKESTYMIKANLNQLFGEGGAHESGYWWEQGPEPSLLEYAGEAIGSMWFQWWKGDFNETLVELDERFELGLEVFLTRVKSYTPHSGQVDVNAYETSTRSYEGLASIGAKLDYLLKRYQHRTAKAGIQSYSLYDLFLMALKNRKHPVRTEMFPLAAAKVLQFEREATYLLQLRHNFLPMMVLAEVTPFKDANKVERVTILRQVWMYQKTGLVERPVTFVDISSLNPERLREYTKWLNMAIETRIALRDLGIEPQYNSTFQKFLRLVEFGKWEALTSADSADLAELSAEERTMMANLRRDFVQAYKDALDPASDFQKLSVK